MPTKDLPEALAGERAAAVVEKNFGTPFFHQQWSSLLKVAVCPIGGGVTEGNQAFLSALADDPHEWRVEVQTVKGKPDQFGDPESGRIQAFEHGAVTQAKRSVDVRRLEQGLDFLGDQNVRYGAPQLRTLEIGGGIIGKNFFLQQETVETPKGGKGARCRPGRESGISAGSEIIANIVAFDFCERETLLLKPPEKYAEIATVGLDGPRAHIPFNREVGEEVVQMIHWAGHRAIMTGECKRTLGPYVYSEEMNGRPLNECRTR